MQEKSFVALMRCLVRMARVLCCAYLFAGGVTAYAGALAPEEMTWAVLDLPPVYILNGEPTVATLGDGVADRLLKMIVAAMPEYRHRLVRMTMPRVLLEMRSGSPVCIVNVQRNDERASLAYATPLLIAPSFTAVFRKEVLDAHPQWRQGVSLQTLVRDPGLVGAYQAKRSFGPTLDAIIQSPDNVSLKPNDAATGLSLLKMTAMGRVDYSIEYASIVVYLAREDLNSRRLETVPLQEADRLVDGYVMCTRDAWGLKATRKIDGILERLAATPAYREALFHWLPAEEVNRNRAAFEDFYRTRAHKRYCSPDCP